MSYLDATRAGYDAMAVGYVARFVGHLGEFPLMRGMLGAFAEIVDGPVLDVGSGPGDVTAFLHGRGVDIRGVDLSPAMVALAREAYPAIRFDEGTMTALDVADGTLGGLVAHYSLIHIPPADRADVIAGFHRALRPGGHVLVAFQVGDDVRHHSEGFGHAISLDFHRLQPDAIAALLTGAGFTEIARLVRAPQDDEPTPHAYLIARA